MDVLCDRWVILDWFGARSYNGWTHSHVPTGTFLPEGRKCQRGTNAAVAARLLYVLLLFRAAPQTLTCLSSCVWVTGNWWPTRAQQCAGASWWHWLGQVLEKVDEKQLWYAEVSISMKFYPAHNSHLLQTTACCSHDTLAIDIFDTFFQGLSFSSPGLSLVFRF